MTREPHRVIFFAFDLLHLNGKDLRKLPLVDRRAKLEALLVDADVEGIVSKRASGRF